MKQEFWHERWEKNEIGFHLPMVHPWLKAVWPDQNVSEGASVFVPLCGKTLDIDYFLQQKMSVVAVELSELAVITLFEQLNYKANVSDWIGGKLYQAENLKVYVGDFFKLTPEHVGHVSVIYDRAAIIALPTEMRQRYAQHLVKSCPVADILSLTFDYAQEDMAGPPFSVSQQEIKQHYSENYNIECIRSKNIIDNEPNFKKRGLNRLTQAFNVISRK